MSKAEWGSKRVCPSCSARYYDMKKNPPVCPSCGTVFDPENVMRSRRGRAAAADKRANAVVAEELDDIPVAVDGEEDEDAVIEDAEELGEEDVVDEVVVGDEE